MRNLLIYLFSFFSCTFSCILAANPYNKPDSIAIVKNIKGFVEWYKANYIKLYDFRLTYTDSVGNYQVDLMTCENYLLGLKSSGFISSEYIRLWRQYFESKAENFKINFQNEGPPEGFDFDLVLHTQEPEEVFKSLKNLKFNIVEIKNNSAIFIVHTQWPEWKYEVELSKIKGRWFIDYISLKEPE